MCHYKDIHMQASTDNPSLYFRVQKRTMEILEKGEHDDKASLWCDFVITTLVLLNIAAVIL